MSAAALPRNTQADQSFGRRLRRERERKRIALSSIAENTKISVSLFQDLERDDASRWPSGIFRKSFIRAYAKAIGLDPDETAREFHELFPDPNDPDQVVLAPPGTVPQPPTAARSGPISPAVVPCPPSASSQSSAPSPTSAPYAASAPPADAGRRPLTLAERATSIAWDAGMIITFGLLLDAVFGTLWMPLTIVMAIYYAGGILLFGSTPGAALQAPSMASLRLRRFVQSSSDESNSSTDTDPSDRNDERTVRPYQAREI
jgi:transcriptional regulator with XRE-family HTH domain